MTTAGAIAPVSKGDVGRAVRFEAPDAEGIGRILIDRPDDSVNAVNPALLEDLASHGYVVAAPDFPLSKFNAPGGASVVDFSMRSRNAPTADDRTVVTMLVGKPTKPSRRQSPFEARLACRQDQATLRVSGLEGHPRRGR